MSWDAVSGVSSYQIWRAGSENTFSNSFASDRILVSSTSGTTYTDSSATHGRQTYQYVVSPQLGGTAYLDGKWSVALVQTPGADRPGNISAVDGDTEDTKFTVSWSTPSDDGGCDITSYAIYLYEYKYLADGSVEVDSDGELPFVSEGTAGASATSWESPSMTRTYRADDGRDYGRQFHVELRAVTAHGEGVPNFILFTGAANTPATGAPSISGTAQVGETLTVDTSGIDDADGMSGAVFSYQWLANDAEITGATLLPHRRMLPIFRRFSIDAHRSDITQSHLIDLPVFG